MRERLETLLEAPYEELHVATLPLVLPRACSRTRRSRPAWTRSCPRSRPADRLALLLERIDDLSLRHHEIRGNPAPLLASFVVADRPAEGRAGLGRRLPRLRRARVAAASDRRRARPRCARARVRPPLRRPRPPAGRARRARLRRPRSLRAFQLLHERPHVRERVAQPLPARARGRVPGHELRPGDAAAPAGRGAPAT